MPYLEDVILTTDNCRYCLMCRHVAPVERVTFKESHTPHGWGLIIASVRRGLLQWNADTVDVIYSAPDGGNSRAHCVTNQPLPAAIAAARAQIVEQNQAPAVVYELDKALQWGNPFEEQAPEPAEGEGDVALFVGDDAYYLWPQALEGALELLGAAGVEPVLIGVGRNNGYLANSLGLPETAKDLARATHDELAASGAQRMLVLSPGDYFTFNQLHEERLGLQWPAGVQLQEVVPFLAEQLDAGALAFMRSTDDTPYAYVDPTHTVRVPARFDAPRRLLASVLSTERRELFWRRERAHPVGNTALQFTKPDISEKLTRARLKDAREAGAQLIVCEDPGTLAHLSRHADEYGLRVQGLYELLAEHLVRGA